MQSICVMLKMFAISTRIFEILLVHFLVEGGTEGMCTCTEKHEIKYEYHDEQKKFSLRIGKSVYMHDE